VPQFVVVLTLKLLNNLEFPCQCITFIEEMPHLRNVYWPITFHVTKFEYWDCLNGYLITQLPVNNCQWTILWQYFGLNIVLIDTHQSCNWSYYLFLSLLNKSLMFLDGHYCAFGRLVYNIWLIDLNAGCWTKLIDFLYFP